MIGDNAKKGLKEVNKKSLIFPRACVDIRSKKVKNNTLPGFEENLAFTDFIFFIKKKVCKQKLRGSKQKKFYLRADMLPKQSKCMESFCRFDTYEELINNEEIKDYIQWFLDNTNLCPRLVEIADKNPGIPIPIAFDAVKYADKIKSEHTFMNNVMMLGNKSSEEAWLRHYRKDLFKDDNSGEDKK